MTVAQSNDFEQITSTISAFAKAADQNDAKSMENLLDDNYRIIMNRLFGSKKLGILSREIYLEKIRAKEFGGDKRTVNIENVVINGTTAMAKVVLAGEKSTFHSLFVLAKDEEGSWKLVSDVPTIQ